MKKSEMSLLDQYSKHLLFLSIFLVILLMLRIYWSEKKESIVINENSSTYYQEINQRDWKLDTMKWTKYHNTSGFSFDYPDTYEVGLFPGVQYSEGVTIYNSDQVKLSPKDNNGNKSEMMRLVRSVNDKNSPRIENFAQSVFKDNTDNDRMLVNVVEPLHLTSFLGVIAYEFTIDSNGFSHVLGTLGSRGIIRIIVVDLHNQRYVIGYYKNPILERVVQSFRID